MEDRARLILTHCVKYESKDGFKNLTDSDLRKARERRYENQKHDYKVLPNGERGKGKAVYRPRRTR